MERARAETALRESEALRRVALAGGRMGSWRWDLGQRLVYGDAQFLALWGFPPSDDSLPLSLFTDRMSPDGAAETEAVVTSAIEADEEFDAFIEIVSGPSARHWLRWRGRAAADDTSVLYGVSFDITEQKQAEGRLRESEERFRQFGEASQDVLWVRNAGSFQWEYLTPAFETIYGLDREAALRGDNMAGWLNLILPQDRERAEKSLRRVREGEWVTFEYRVRRPLDGEIRWLRNTDFPIQDETGKVTRIGGVGHDITLLKQTEEALAAAESRQRALLEGIPQLVWRAGCAGEWTWASPQWSAFTGQAQSESRDWGWLEVVAVDDRPRSQKAWADAPMTGFFEVEHRLRKADTGGYRWFRTRATAVRDTTGEIVEWLGTSTDVQDLRSLQDRQRILLHELQHRVRNTLAVVRSMALSTGKTSDTVEDFAAHLEGRLSALARTQMVLTRSPGDGVDLEALVRDELLAQAAHEARLHIDGPDVRLSAKAAEVLALAVHELATNAVKYGALGAEAGRVSVCWTTSERSGEVWLELIWQESGVRVLSSGPRREGFGTELIEMRVPYELDGSGKLEFLPGGVRCRVEFPMVAGESILQTNAPAEDVEEGRS